MVAKFKRNYNPLTIQTLQVERDKQATKEKESKRIKDSIQEGKEREAKNKLRKQKANVWIYKVLMYETQEDHPAPIRSQIELQGTTCKVLYNALLDIRASHNLISFDAWNQLGRPPLDQPPIKVKGVNGLTSYIMGVLTAQLYAYNGHMEASFLVMPAGELSKNIILGRTWMSSTNCQIEWVTNSVATIIPKCPIGHCAHCEPHSLPPSPTTTSQPILPIEHLTNSSETMHAQVTTNKRQQNNPPPTCHKTPNSLGMGAQKPSSSIFSRLTHSNKKNMDEGTNTIIN